MNKSRLRLLSALWIVRLLLLSCTNTAHYDSYQRIENPWQKDKEYYVELELGYETDTYDAEGITVSKYNGEIKISEEKAVEVINSFIGEILLFDVYRMRFRR